MTLNAYPVPGTIFLSDFNILSSFKKKKTILNLIIPATTVSWMISSWYTSWICSSYELILFSIPMIPKLSLHQNKFRKFLKHASAWALYQISQGRPPCWDAGMLYLTSCPDDSMWSWPETHWAASLGLRLECRVTRRVHFAYSEVSGLETLIYQTWG